MNNRYVSIINLTPHEVLVYWEDNVAKFPSQGVARLTDVAEQEGFINGVPLVTVRGGEEYGLPEEEEGTVYIVSRVLAQAFAGTEREDLVFPFGEIRDHHGRIIAVTSLARFV